MHFLFANLEHFPVKVETVTVDAGFGNRNQQTARAAAKVQDRGSLLFGVSLIELNVATIRNPNRVVFVVVLGGIVKDCSHKLDARVQLRRSQDYIGNDPDTKTPSCADLAKPGTSSRGRDR